MLILMAFGCMIAAIALACWAGRDPLKPATIVRDKRPICVDCRQHFSDAYFHVMRCDKCLLAYLNRIDEGEFDADGALSVNELERMWDL